MTSRPVPALIPMASPLRAKGRLAAILDPDQRRELALTSLRTVVEAAASAGAEPVVLTPVPALLGPIEGGRLMAEAPGSEGLNSALEAALRRLPPGPVLILHADLPLASASELGRLLGVLEGSRAPLAVVVRSRDGGTNALAADPARSFPLSYGPNSFSRHVAAAHAAGVAVVALASTDLSLDLDTAADIRALLATERGRDSHAGRLLRRWGFGPSQSLT